jgi:hypothetical protein
MIRYRDPIAELWRDEAVRDVLGLDTGARNGEGTGKEAVDEELGKGGAANDSAEGKGARMKVRLEDCAAL